MVQVFDPTPRASQAGMLGQSLGGALGGYAGQEILGLRQKSALENCKNMLQKGDNPAEVTMKWTQATAGTPGMDKIGQNVLPQYQLLAMMNLWNQGQPPIAGQSQPVPGQPMPVQSQPYGMPMGGGGAMPISAISPGAEVAGLNQPSPGPLNQMIPQTGAPSQVGAGTGAPVMSGGLNPNIMQMSMLTGQPYEKLLERYAGLPQEKINADLQELTIRKTQNLSDFAQEKLPQETTPEELNQFMRMGTKYQNLQPEDWFKATHREFQKYKSARSSFDRANIPGIISGIFRGGKYREETLKKLTSLAKPLIDIGEDEYVRSALSKQGLSPTEVEMIVKPLDKSGLLAAKNLASSPYAEIKEGFFEPEHFEKRKKPFYDELLEMKPEMIDQMTDKYSNFLLDNVKPNVSLLGLRDYLRHEKGIDWRHFYDMIQRAQEKGLVLDIDQQNEMAELTNAPRDSLGYIFQSSGRIWDYLRGAK